MVKILESRSGYAVNGKIYRTQKNASKYINPSSIVLHCATAPSGIETEMVTRVFLILWLKQHFCVFPPPNSSIILNQQLLTSRISAVSTFKILVLHCDSSSCSVSSAKHSFFQNFVVTHANHGKKLHTHE